MKDYGDAWFVDREALLGVIPLRDDYGAAEDYVKEFKRLVKDAKLSSDAERDLWNMITALPYTSRILVAAPTEFEKLQKVAEHGIRSIYQPNSTRTTAELDEIGRCLDKIRPGRQSTLPQAGRGAFATRLIRKGEIVIGTPLIFTPTADFYKMYEGDWLLQSEKPEYGKIKQMQLIINYSWKHPESSLFLIPYGPLVQLINHNQTRANVRVQWAKDGEMSQKEGWLTKSPEDMFPRTTPGLFWDFVATRDIHPEEEIFLDYGDEWENAWISFVKNWQPPPDSATYKSAREWSEENADAILKTEEEQVKEPYPSNFETRCLADIIYEGELTHEVAKQLWHEKAQSMVCTVQEKRKEPNGEYLYKVHYLPLGLLEEVEQPVLDEEDGMVTWYVSDWIPRGAISFVDSPYTTDIFLDTAFRHPIQIPDEIFPEPWRGFQGVLYW